MCGPTVYHQNEKSALKKMKKNKAYAKKVRYYRYKFRDILDDMTE